MTSVELMYWTVGFTAFVIAVGWMCYVCGKRVEAQHAEEREQVKAEREQQARAYRAALLRENGRIHEVRDDASGAPAVVRPIRVLGRHPSHRPSTRM